VGLRFIPFATLWSFYLIFCTMTARPHLLTSSLVLRRDLKPQNILVSPGGRQLKLADFGLARAIPPFQRALTVEVSAALFCRVVEVHILLSMEARSASF
jgi:serine/threonine protein kinase